MPTRATTRRSLLRVLGLASVGSSISSSEQRALATQAAPVSRPASLHGVRAGEARRVQEVALRWCPPGRFLMGSPAAERGHRPDEAQVEVALSRGFWTAAHEVTQRDWTRVMGAYPDQPPTDRYGLGDDVPVYWISFDEALAFCAELTRRARAAGEIPAGWTFTLPTEAQWEYACRAGTTATSAFGDPLTPAQANIATTSAAPMRERRPGERRSQPSGSAVRVGSYPPNPWGLHDMHGNVWEWCRDWYHAALPGGTDPDMSTRPGVPNGDGTYSRVRRGGAWVEEGWACRSAMRLRFEPHRRSDHIGFRVVLVEA